MPLREMFLIIFTAIVALISITIADKLSNPKPSPILNPPPEVSVKVEPLKEPDKTATRIEELERRLEQANLQIKELKQPPLNPPPVSQLPPTVATGIGTNSTITEADSISPKITALQQKVPAFLSDSNRNWQINGIELINELEDIYKVPRLSIEQNTFLEKSLQSMLLDAVEFIKGNYKTMSKQQAKQFISAIKIHKKFIAQFQQNELQKLEIEIK